MYFIVIPMAFSKIVLSKMAYTPPPAPASGIPVLGRIYDPQQDQDMTYVSFLSEGDASPQERHIWPDPPIEWEDLTLLQIEVIRWILLFRWRDLLQNEVIRWILLFHQDRYQDPDITYVASDGTLNAIRRLFNLQ